MAASKAKVERSKELRVKPVDGRSEERNLAEVGIDPTAHGMATALLFNKGTFGALPTTETFEAVRASIAAVRNGNMAGPVAMLMAQATALNSIFTELARRAAANMGEYIKATESYMRMALKAQAQCRSTLETLAMLKNPPVVFARQANISSGPQQVNNHAPAPSARAEKPETMPNELLETDQWQTDGRRRGERANRRR